MITIGECHTRNSPIGEDGNTKYFFLLTNVRLVIRQFGERTEEIRQFGEHGSTVMFYLLANVRLVIRQLAKFLRKFAIGEYTVGENDYWRYYSRPLTTNIQTLF